MALPEREPPDSPGWTVRVVPNLFPAFERQEVVVHSPRHARSFADLDDEEVRYVSEAWQARRRTKSGGYLHALVNEGRAAGASLPHSHSQLVWIAADPPAVAAEQQEGCAVCDLLNSADPVLQCDQVCVVSPPAARVPYELLIAPREHEREGFASPRLAPALTALRDAVARLRAVEGAVAWNAWLHVGSHWHLEVVPRLTVLAGVELGAGIYVNPLAPETAAAALRDV